MADPIYVDFDEPARALYEDWREARAAAEAWSDRRDELAHLLMQRMGEATRGTIDGHHVVTRVPETTITRFDERRFHDAMPDTWAEFLTPQHRSGFLRIARRRS